MKIIEDNQNYTLYENNIKIFKPSVILGFDNIEWGRNIMIDHYVTIDARKQKVRFGNYIHIPIYSSITGGGGFEMGNFSTLSHGVRIITSSDDFTGHGFGNPTIPLRFRNVKSAPVIIGDFCVIGAESVILPGVKIAEGATVGANSTITKSLSPWEIYVGVNKRIGNRDKSGVLSTYKKFLEQNEVYITL
jgi:acetyltransferase-like isoleucine patch superfamily enzyme